MTYSPINVAVYTAAFSGAIAGMGVSGWITDQTSSDYEDVTLIAGAFAQAFDQVWNNAAQLNNLELSAITAIVQTDFSGRGPGPFNNPTFQDPNNWTKAAGACAALVLESDIFFTNEGINPGIPGNTTASALQTTTTVVNVSSATAPALGEVLTAINNIKANWQYPEAINYFARGGSLDDLPDITSYLALAATVGTKVRLSGKPTFLLNTPPNGSGTFAPYNSTPNLLSNEFLKVVPGSNIRFDMTYRFGFYASPAITPGSNLASAPATQSVVNNVAIVNPWSNIPQVGYLVWIQQISGLTPNVSGSTFIISALGQSAIGTNDVTASGLYGGGGSLNGKTLILSIDGNSSQTLTLSGAGNTANLTAFIAAIVAEWPTLFQVGVGGAAGNKLLISSSSILIGAGTANSTLGLTAGIPTYASILLNRPIVWQNSIGDTVGWCPTYPKNINMNFAGAKVEGYANQPFEFVRSQNIVIDSLNYELTQSQIPFPGGMATIGFDIGCNDCVLQNSTIIFPQDPIYSGTIGLYCQSNEHTLVWNTTVRNAQLQGYAFLDCYACAGIFINSSDCAWGFSAQKFDDPTFGSLDCAFIACNDAGSNIGQLTWGSKRIKSIGCSTTKNPIYGLKVDRNSVANTFTNQSHTDADVGVYVDVTATGTSFVQLNTDDCRIGLIAASNVTVSQWHHHSTHAENTALCAFISGTGTNVLRDIDFESLSGSSNGIDVQGIGTLIVDGGHITVGSLGYCLQVENACNVSISRIVFTGEIGINCTAGVVNIGPGCDFTGTTTPFIVSGTGKITFQQSGGIFVYSGFQRFMVLTECYNTEIEVNAGSPAAVGLPGIPGLQFTIFNGSSANFTAISTASSDPGVIIAPGKTAIVRVNSTNHCVRVTADT